MTKLTQNLRALFRKEKLDADMAEEMRQHLERRTQANLAAGMSPDEARYAAQRQFGGVEQLKEIAREQRPFLWLDHLLQDLRFAGRMLRKTPGFTVVTVVSLAVGIGLNTAVFSIINTLFYQTIRGVPEPRRVMIFNDRGASVEGYRRLRDQTIEVAALSAARSLDGNIECNSRERRGRIIAVAADYFAVLGARPALGRFFISTGGNGDASAYDAPEAVLTHTFWETHLDGDRAVLGRVLRINGTSVTVVGVSAPEFHGPGPEGPAMWVPLGLASALTRGRSLSQAASEDVGLIGRLRPGVTLGQAQTAIDVVAARSPEVFGEKRFRVSLGREDWRGGVSAEKRIEFLLVTAVPLVVVGGLLWIACSNVANLLLARAVQRRKEIAIRIASGASRGRLMRMLMAESVLLALLGGGAGLWVSQATLDFIFATLSEFNALSVQLDVRVLCYTTGVCVAAAILFGLIPALQASKTDVTSALKGDGSQGSPRGSRMRSILLASQIATSVALLIVAGTFIKSLIGAAYVGDQARFLDHLVTAQLPRPAATEPKATFYANITERLRALPGVEAVTILESARVTQVFSRLGDPPSDRDTKGARHVAVQRIDPNYAATTGLTLQRGAMLTPLASEVGLQEALINEAMARAFWPAGDALGARFDLKGDPFIAVGVVRDGSVDSKAYTQLPLADLADAGNAATWIRVRGEAEAAVPAIAALLRQSTAVGEPIHVAPLREVAFRSVTILARLGGYIGFLALSFAAAGVYASTAFSTTQRTREIGVRMALGATRRSVLALMLRHATGVIGWGAAIGVVLALVGLRLLFKLMTGAGSGVDLVAIASVILFFAVVVGLACLVPAWRAAKVDPMVALRAE